MEIYLQFIFLMAILKYSLKSALTRKIGFMSLYALFASIVAYLIYPFMIKQRGDSFTSILMNKGLVEDAAVLIAIEAVLGIFISIFLLDKYFLPKDKRKKRFFALKVMPGFLVFVGLAYFQLLFFKQFVGMDFRQTALIYSGVVFAVIFLLSFVFYYLCPEESQKLEVKIILNILILTVGLFMNATITRYSQSHSQTALEITPLLLMIALVLICALSGFLLFKYKRKKY